MIKLRCLLLNSPIWSLLGAWWKIGPVKTAYEERIVHFNKLGKGPLGNATYQISNIWARWFWRRRFFNIFLCISVHFYGSNLGPLVLGHPGPWDLGLNELGKGPPSNATYQISSTWAKQFWRRRFLSIFHFWTQDPPTTGPFWTPGPPFEQTWLRSTRQCYIPNIKALGSAVSEEMSFEAILDDRRRTTGDARLTTDNRRWTLADGNSSGELKMMRHSISMTIK